VAASHNEGGAPVAVHDQLTRASARLLAFA
jgi:hypothetical protein